MNKIEELSAARRKNKILVVKKFNIRENYPIAKKFFTKSGFYNDACRFLYKRRGKNAKNPKLSQEFTA